MMRKQISFAVVAVSLAIAHGRGQDAKFVDDNLKFSREFYAKVHFVAVSNSPTPFKYDRYPDKGPERFQCEDGTYLHQHGHDWKHVDQPMRRGLPVTYGEMDRYVMTLAGKSDWGKSGGPVEKATAEKLAGWIRLIDAAFGAQTGELKLVNKSETEGRAQWIFEVAGSSGSPTRLTFRKPANDKAENVLLHEFSGSWRVDGDKVVAGGATDSLRLGFGYMMPFQGGQEVSEFVWEEMHNH
jgi:hypothetical protein